MNAQTTKRVLDLFDEVCDLPAPDREAILSAHRAAEPKVVSKVERLLAEDAEGGAAGFDAGQGADLLAAGATGAGSDLPEWIGRYRVIREIGRGGMGVVFEANQEDPKRRVALKVLRDGFATPEVQSRFRREATILGRLRHPGIAHVYEAGRADSGGVRAPFIAMELIDGAPIDEYADSRGLDVRQRLELVARACDAVQHAHEQGVLHRDLKPANILVVSPARSESATRSSGTDFDLIGQPKVVDFGVAGVDGDERATTIAGRTRVGQVIGTLGYISPEQLSGDIDHVGTRSDVYALGVVLYVLLAGRLPRDPTAAFFAGDVGTAASMDAPPLGSIDKQFRGDIETVVSKAIENDPERRYASASELAEDIRRYLRDDPILARPATMTYQLKKLARRNRPAVFGAAATLGALLVGIVATTWFAIAAVRNEAEAMDAREASDRQAYRAGIAAASAALRERDVGAAERYLRAVPRRLRAWEFEHFSSRLDESVASGRRTNYREPGFSPTHIWGMAWIMDNALHVCIAGRASCVSSFALESLDEIVSYPFGGTIVGVDFDNRVLGVRDGSDGELTLSDLQSGDDLGSVGTAARPSSIGRIEAIVPSAEALSAILTSPMFQSRSASHALGMSPDGRWVARAEGPTVWVTTPDGEVLFESTGHVEGFSDLTFSPDSTLLAGVTFGRRLVMFDLARGSSPLWLRDETHTDAPLEVAFSPDGRRLFSAGQDRLLRFWDTASGEPAGELMGHRGTIFAGAWSDDGSTVYTADVDAVYAWDANASEDPFVMSTGDRSAGVLRISEDGTTLVSSQKGVLVWDVETGYPFASLGTFGTASDTRRRVDISPDGARIASGRRIGSEDLFEVWSLRTGERTAERRSSTADRLFSQITFSPDGSMILYAGSRGAALDASTLEPVGTVTGATRILWHRATGQVVGFASNTAYWMREKTPGEWVLGKPLGPVHRSDRPWALSPDGRHAFVAWNDHVEQVDTTTFEVKREYRGHTFRIRSMAVAPGGTRFFTGGLDGVIRVWDPELSTTVASLRGHVDRVTGLAMTPNGRTLFSASDDYTIRRWGAESRGELMTARRAYRDIVSRLRPLITSRLDDGRTPSDVAAWIEAQHDLSDRERTIAGHCLVSEISRRTGNVVPFGPHAELTRNTAD